MKLETMLLALACAGAGCAHDGTIAERVNFNAPHLPTAQRIAKVGERQFQGESYGQGKCYESALSQDGFTQEGHVFATRIYNDGTDFFITFMGDNVSVTDVNGDGSIDSSAVFDEKYDLASGHTRHRKTRVIEVQGNLFVTLFEDALLTVLEEKYATGMVSPNTITDYLKAKNDLLYETPFTSSILP